MKKLFFFLTVFLLSGIFATKNYSQSKANTKKADYQDPKNWGPGWNNTNGDCKACDSIKNFPMPMFVYHKVRYPIVDSGVFVKHGAEKCAESFYYKILLDSTQKEASTNFFGTELITVTRYKYISNGHLVWQTVYGDKKFLWFRFTLISLSIFIIVFLLFFFYYYKKK